MPFPWAPVDLGAGRIFLSPTLRLNPRSSQAFYDTFRAVPIPGAYRNGTGGQDIRRQVLVDIRISAALNRRRVGLVRVLDAPARVRMAPTTPEPSNHDH